MFTERRDPAMEGLQLEEVFLFGERGLGRHIDNVFRPQFHPSCILGISVAKLLSPTSPFLDQKVLVGVPIKFAIIFLTQNHGEASNEIKKNSSKIRLKRHFRVPFNIKGETIYFLFF